MLAHDDSIAYRATKFIRRHRAGVAAAAAIVVALVAGALATAWQWRVAERERTIAERRFNDVRNLARSVVFEIHDAVADLPGATKARALIVRKRAGVSRCRRSRSHRGSRPELEVAAAYARISEIQANIGTANLGDEKAAITTAEKALAMRRSVTLAYPDHAPALRALAMSLRQMAYLKFDTPEADDLLGELLELRERIAGMTADPEDAYNLAAAHHNYGQYLAAAGRLDDALNEFARGRAGYETRLKADPGHLMALGNFSLLMKNIGAVHHREKRLDLALASYQQALELDDARLAKEPDSVQAKMNKTFSLGSIAGALGDGGRTREAIEYHRRALAIREQISAQDPANASALAIMLRSHQSIGLLQVRDDPAAAIATLLQAQRVIESRSVRTRELDTVAAWIYASIGDAYGAAAKAASNARLRAEHRQQAIASVRTLAHGV